MFIDIFKVTYSQASHRLSSDIRSEIRYGFRRAGPLINWFLVFEIDYVNTYLWRIVSIKQRFRRRNVL